MGYLCVPLGNKPRLMTWKKLLKIDPDLFTAVVQKLEKYKLQGIEEWKGSIHLVVLWNMYSEKIWYKVRVALNFCSSKITTFL